MTTLSPQNVLRSGEGASGELRLDELNAPGREGAAAGVVVPLGDAPLALFLDVDGTLLDLAARPEDVVTPAGLVSTLAGAERKLAGALALISGRSIDDLDLLFAPLRLRVSGVHGAEIRFHPDASIAPTVAADLPQSLLDALRRAVQPFPGVFVENKRFSFTVHYRLAPSAERPLRNIVKELVDALPIAVDMMDAHCAIEIEEFRVSTKAARSRRFSPARRFAGARPSSSATIQPMKAVLPSSARAEGSPTRSAVRVRARLARSRDREPCASGSPSSRSGERAYDRGQSNQKAKS